MKLISFFILLVAFLVVINSFQKVNDNISSDVSLNNVYSEGNKLSSEDWLIYNKKCLDKWNKLCNGKNPIKGYDMRSRSEIEHDLIEIQDNLILIKNKLLIETNKQVIKSLELTEYNLLFKKSLLYAELLRDDYINGLVSDQEAINLLNLLP